MDEQGVIRGFQRIGAEGQRLEGTLQKVGSRGNVVFTELTKQQNQARDAAQLLSRSLGVEVPRAVQKVITQSNVLGPLLSQAFSATIAVAFAQAIYTAVEPAIIAVINHLHAFEDAVAQMEARNAAASNKLLEQSEANTKALRLRAQLAGADEIRSIEIKLAADLADIHRRQQKAGNAGSVHAARQLIEEKKALEKAAAAEIGAIHEKAERERMKKILEGYEAFLKRRTESMRKFREDILGAERTQQDAAIEAVIGNLEGEERVNNELEWKIALLEELKRKYKGFGQIAESITVQQEQAERRAAREIQQIRQQQLMEWQQNVRHMAASIQSFLDNPIQYLRNLWKRFLAEMVASWILSTRAMSGGGAAPGGGFSLGGMLRGLFGLGGGGFSLPGGTVGGMQLPPGVNTTFPSGQVMPGVGGLAYLPMSARSSVGMGAIIPAGASLATGAKLSMGAQLAQMWPMLVAGGGMAGIGAIGFGSPARGAMSTMLGGALGLGGLSAALGFGFMPAMLGLLTNPLGWAALAAFALVGGLFGKSAQNKQKRQAMDILNQGRAQWKNILADFESHRIDYAAAIAGVTQVWQQMVQQWSSPALGKYGGIAIQNNAAEFRRTLQQIEDLQARRQWTAQSPMWTAAGEFSTGGFVGASMRAGSSSFGPLGIPLMPSRGLGRMPSFASGGAVPIIAHAGEFVMQRAAVQRIGRSRLEAMNSGAARGLGPEASGGPMIVVQGPLVQAAPGMSTEQLAEATIRKLERLLRDEGVHLRA